MAIFGDKKDDVPTVTYENLAAQNEDLSNMIELLTEDIAKLQEESNGLKKEIVTLKSSGDERLKKEIDVLKQENANLKKRLERAKKRDTPRGMGR